MKNVGVLKYVLVALLVSPQLMFAMATHSRKAEHQQTYNCPICFGETNHVLHANHIECSDCLADRIDLDYNQRAVLINPMSCSHPGCNYQLTQADVQRIAPQSVAQFQAIQQAQAQKANLAHPKIDEDRENLRWKFEKTKPCPHCHRAIEKDGGCKFVVCAQCNTDFCYECLHISFNQPGRRDRGHEWDHQLCISRDGWESERAQLFMQEAPLLIVGSIVFIAAVWGISELYEYFQKKKAKRAQQKNNRHKTYHANVHG